MRSLSGSGSARHAVLFYRSRPEYLAAVTAFLRAGLARGDAALAMVPGSRAGPLSQALGADAQQVTFAGPEEARNPGRIIAAVRAFAGRQAGRPVCCAGEPAWPGRSERELVEVARHEALVNVAFAEGPLTSLCLYDAGALPAGVLAAAQQTHPAVATPGGLRPSPAYLGAGEFPAACRDPLPAPPPGAETLPYHTDLRPVRELIGRWQRRAGLSPDQATDLALAVSELAGNTLRHTAGGGTVRIWQDAGEVVCELSDQGWITDPLAGRQHVTAEFSGGGGLWVVNQVCDLVEMRTGPAGTTTRLHMRIAGGSGQRGRTGWAPPR